jgi:spermidine/putrescine transport system ATP-binding protein
VANFVGTANRFAGRVEGVQADRYAVAIDGVGLRAANGPAGLASGSAVLVLVRPENLVLNGSVGGGASLDASVTDTAFLGAERTVRLHSPTLGELTATARGSGDAPEQGSRVGLSWADEDAWLIPAAKPEP